MAIETKRANGTPPNKSGNERCVSIVGLPEISQKSSASAVAEKGIKTIEDVELLMAAVMTDVINGSVSVKVAKVLVNLARTMISAYKINNKIKTIKTTGNPVLLNGSTIQK